MMMSSLTMMSAVAWAQAPSSLSKQQKNNADEAAVFERILNHVRFENDGTEVSETEAVVRVQSQAGVEAVSYTHLIASCTSATLIW